MQPRLCFSFSTTFLSTVALATVALGQTGTIAGRVTGSGSEPLQGASVNARGTSRGAIARQDGSYSFSLPAGRYELHARLLGYVAASDSVTVTAGSTTTANFTL